jgi:diaminopimelate epimerase
MKKFFFAKYHARGNDFIIFDDRKRNVLEKFSEDVIKKLCHRNLSVGSDGIIFLQNSKKCDYKMRIFNSDGSEATSCGNGLCCLFTYIKDNNFKIKNADKISLETLSGDVLATFDKDNRVSIEMDFPKLLKKDFKLQIDKTTTLEMSLIDSGVMHVVIFENDVIKVDLEKISPLIRYHQKFKEIGGVNVNFVKVDKKSNELFVRTYEKGVEAETKSCGTGAIAAAYIASEKYLLKNPVKIITHLGIANIILEKKIKSVTMTTKAINTFNGFVKS